MACMNGPLMGEEMMGACFVIDEVEVCDKKGVEFLCALAEGEKVHEEESKIEVPSLE